jgi:hypothetical protein
VTDIRALIATYVQRFGCVLNADNASELFPEYTATPDARALLGPAVRPNAARIVDAVYARRLAEPVISPRLPVAVFTSGGNGSGKTSSVPAAGGKAHVVLDSTLSQLEASTENIERALEADLLVYIRHLARDVIDAWENGVLARAMDPGSRHPGRTVMFRGHLLTHRGARRTLIALAERYRCEHRVRIEVWENGQRGLTRRSVEWLAMLRDPDDEYLKQQLRSILDAEFAAGRISAAVYGGSGGEGL